MDVSFVLSRLRTQTAEMRQITHHLARKTKKDMEESLFAWRDTQATKFSVAIVEPQQSGFEPLTRRLTEIESYLKGSATLSDEAASRVAQIRLNHDNIQRSCSDCESKVQGALAYASDARSLAHKVNTTAERLSDELKKLGNPQP